MPHAVRNEAVSPRSRAPALERNALEAPASSKNPRRQEPQEQRVPRLEPRNKGNDRLEACPTLSSCLLLRRDPIAARYAARVPCSPM